ncbi:MAG TPA: DNA polymerase III subunit gamma/tau [Dehalococcoidia bacterium]|nr:DNA polymerase III subunit gamma/tau [Dehalococcoidia bacterium]
MDSQVFYRKWRPQTLADVVGQEQVTRTLLNALGSSRVSHAYLFCGPRGTGKTSTGRILSKAVNCLNNGKGEPCNECDICRAITEGRALDIIEIDAASNRGIDEIRELRERVNYAPGQAKYKVYIIDEVHMLTKEASNALLKTLEEPPPSVIFVLATTEAHKVLPTIMSRCQRFDFRRVNQDDMISKLNRICKAEGIKMETEAVRLVARSSAGSLRDAENLLEQLTTFYGSEISLPQVQSVLGITSDKRAKELAGYIAKGDITYGMKTINAVSSEGLDLKQFNRELVAYLRGLLLIKNGCQDSLDFTAEELAELKELAAGASQEHILKAVKLFGHLDLGSDNYATLPLELALVDCALASSGETVPFPKPAESDKPFMEKAPKPKAASLSRKKKVEGKTEQPEDVPIPEEAGTDAETLEPSSLPAEPAGTASPEVSDRVEQLESNWKQVIEQAPESTRRTPAIAILRSAGIKPVVSEDGTVILAFKYPYLKDKIEETENMKVTTEIISSFLGYACRVRCVYESDNNHLVQEAQRLGAKIIDVEEK